MPWVSEKTNEALLFRSLKETCTQAHLSKDAMGRVPVDPPECESAKEDFVRPKTFVAVYLIVRCRLCLSFHIPLSPKGVGGR
jgi:hypothetical protein